MAEEALREDYFAEGTDLIRSVHSGRFSGTSAMHNRAGAKQPDDPHHAWWRGYLRGADIRAKLSGELSIVDLFCGCGGLSLGASEAARSVGIKPHIAACADMDEDTIAVYRRNFRPDVTIRANIAGLVDYHCYGRGASAKLAYDPEIVDSKLCRLAGRVDLVLAGPPCQGRSNLNNYTRGDDPRDLLYMAAVAIGIALSAKAIVIENVPGVTHDASEVLYAAKSILEKIGYSVSDGVLHALSLGGCQTRRRHFLVATVNPHLPVKESARILKKRPMNLWEAIGDLEDHSSNSIMDQVPSLSQENQSRIDYLFDNNTFELPNAVRPDCHKNGHTYPSVYGRLSWEKPAQTITTGFLTPGRGRFIHPSRRRVLTPSEAARIQGFPDWFDFIGSDAPPTRSALAQWIGDAVPTQVGYSAVLTALTGV